MLGHPHRPRRRLESRVVLLCGMTVLPFVVFFMWLAWVDLGRQLKESEKDAAAAARIVAGEFTQVRRMVAHVLRGFATLSRNNAPLASLCGKTLQEIVSPVPFFQAAIADLNGDVKCGLRHIPPGTNISDREYFHRAIQKAEFATSGFVKGRATGRSTIVAGFPLFDTAERVRGVVLLSIDLAWLQQIIADIDLPRGASASIVDGAGKIIARYPEAEGLIGTTISDIHEFIDSFPDARSRVMRYRGVFRSAPVVAGAVVREDDTNPAFVRVEIPDAVVTETARALVLRGVGTSFVILLVSAAFAWWMSRRLIVNPIRQLREASKRVGIDDLSVRTGYADDGSELGELASSFDHMAERLQRSVRALRALSAGNRTIIRPQTEPELLQAMCKVAVDVGGYQVAMVHYALHDEGKTLELRAHAGTHADCLKNLRLTWADRDIRRGPPGFAVRTRRYCVVHHLTHDRRTTAWRTAAEHQGFGSVISFPLTVEGEVIGAFTLLSTVNDAFDDNEIELLAEMADDLAFGVTTVRAHAEKERIREAMDHTARHNRITGLPNRTELVSRIQQMIADSTRRVRVYVAYIARKHEFLDSLGHEATNDILKTVARRLSDLTANGAIVGHIALDEFACIAPDATIDASIGRRMQEAFEEPVDVHGAMLDVQAHIGLARFPDHGEEADLLLRRAAVAARQAVDKERSLFVYKPIPENEQIERLALVAELRQAVVSKQLELHYQPKFDLKTNRPIAREALLRWRRRNGETVPPGVFIPLAERTGLIRDITHEVLALALRELSRESVGTTMPIAINLTARSLYDADFLREVLRGTEQLGVPPGHLELEITESALIQDPQRAMKTIRFLRDSGFRVYIDDFGTGYSSMSYLVQLPVSGLKIDQSFIAQMTHSEQAYAVVASIISMAERLMLEVVAEGVETAEQADMLRSLECHTAQGFFYGRPVSAT